MQKHAKITPEAFFRLCDTKYNQEFDHQRFREMAWQLKLELEEATINNVLAQVDEEKTKLVTIYEYYNTLEAFDCRGEKESPFDDTPGSNISFKQ